MSEGKNKRSKNRLPDPKNDKCTESTYPYNIVDVWPSWRREIDNTPGKERYAEYHKSGTYRKINADGQISEMGVANKHEYVKGTNVTTIDGFTDMITKGSKIVIKGGKLMEFGGHLDWHILGDFNQVVGKNKKTTVGGNETVSARGNMYAHANKGTFKVISGKTTYFTAGEDHVQSTGRNNEIKVAQLQSTETGTKTLKTASYEITKKS